MNETIKKKEFELYVLKEEVKGLKRREKLIERLGFSELVPEEYFSLPLEELDNKILELNLNGKIDTMKYITYFSKRKGFYFPTFEELLFK